jgi:hypothetical protein
VNKLTAASYTYFFGSGTALTSRSTARHIPAELFLASVTMPAKAIPAVPVSVAPISEKFLIISCSHLQDFRDGFLLRLDHRSWYLACRDCILMRRSTPIRGEILRDLRCACVWLPDQDITFDEFLDALWCPHAEREGSWTLSCQEFEFYLELIAYGN